ncbi:ran-binding protein 3-like isoform X2 [Mizuhopecten yessoensis]|uniref:Ran-binding protein 3 n=1 Tax=Mizuhopecten yessoensis TaxID=6573 RepID=A0A210PEL0_MIZYE|nr:ran-binding protein 3-like isoform X2 [Mizuhopecten yessoensis]OWF34920.1 Ran-binding protein 3 [Mizuhopecten yessoensis]
MADVYTESSGDPPEDNTVEEESGEIKHTEQSSGVDDSTKAWSTTPQNPFAPRPALKTDIVSTASHHHHFAPSVHLAPSKFSQPGAASGDPDSDEDRGSPGHKSSILLPSRLGILNKADTMPSPSKCLLRPSPLAVQVQSMKQKDEKDSKEKENQDTLDREDNHNNGSGDPPINSSGLPGPTAENYFATALTGNEKLSDSTTDAGGGGAAAAAAAPEFIFGQNLTDRVTGVQTSPGNKTSPTSDGGFVFGTNLAERVVKTDGADKKNERNQLDSDDESELSKSTGLEKARTLEESAREFQAKHDRRPEYKEVEVKTGEEDESNVLQSTGKLFVFDGHNQSWIERGRGLLRINDQRSQVSSEFQSRLVMRTQGSLRVILNTKIWPAMTIERASQKSLRITATDGEDGVRVFLIITSPKDCENILRAVDWRIQQLRMREEQVKDIKGTEKRKADSDSATEESSCKKARSSDESSTAPCNTKREESDSSVLDPETDVSSESCTSSSLTVRSESD